MNPRELMRAAMRLERTERIPAMPQICHDLAVRIYEGEFAADWIDGMKSCAENPGLIYDLIIRLARRTAVDGLRLFVRSDPLRVERAGESLVVLDRSGEKRLGRLDIHGGGEFVPDRQDLPVETLSEFRVRLNRLEAEFTEEKLELLREARARVPDLFVASAPGGITMNTYVKFRGREQAMMDLCERPDFVRAAFDMQTDIMIKRAEKLVGTGIDALYIGDPAASSSLISPRQFEEFCLPAYLRFCRHFKETDILIYIHICGNSRPILEMMASTGVHAVEPLDPLGGVSVEDAKLRIGNRVALMGGVNTLTLSGGTAAEVRAEAVQKCREGGPFGYILAAGDMVPPGTPLENLQALADVATRSLWRN